MNLKMHDYISKGQSRNKTISYNQNLKEKLKHFHHKELITELEFQSFQIEDLLKQREHLDNSIKEFKNDTNVHNQIEKNLSKKIKIILI